MSTTMLGSYDAQMLDYHLHDVDVHMNTSINSESWTQEEAIMEDDGLRSTHKATYENVSIEVDMEDYDENVTEFDMLNDSQRVYDGDGTTELVDVEVYDVTQVHSPAFVAQPVPSDLDTSVSRVDGDQHQDTEGAVFRAAENGIQPETAELTPTHHTDLAESLVVEEHIVDGSSIGQIGSNPVVEVGTEGAGLPKNDTPADLASSSSGDPPPASGTTDGAHIDLSGEASDEQYLEHKANPGIDNREVAHEEPAQIVAYEDPHEISEGVYIDPPPSVLLTIDITDRFDVSLFNEATTVIDLGDKQENSTSVILLQHRPTLYYESLSAVFEELRQDTFLSEISDISEGELVLEAYDLQLVMPEDNCYVRGLSLHDINMLHDVHGLLGPLRLKLRLDMPRFIIRYQRLQERIGQLSIENQEAEPNQQDAQNGTDYLEYVENEKEPHFVDLRAQLLHPEERGAVKENEQDDIETKPSQELATPNLLEEDSYELEYVDNAETGPTAASGEAEVCENRDSSGTRIGLTSGVVPVFEEEYVKTVGEPTGIESREGDVSRLTSRSPSLHLSEKVSEDAVSTLIPGEVARAEDTGTDAVDQSHNIEDITGQFISDASYAADNSHESISVNEVYDHDVSAEEQPDSIPVIPIVSSDPETREEAWDDELYEGEADTSWDRETNQDEEEQESTSAESSVTLSSRLSSKRSFHELDNEDETPSQSPEPKKVRTE